MFSSLLIPFLLSIPTSSFCRLVMPPPLPASGETGVPTNAFLWPDISQLSGPSGNVELVELEKYGAYVAKTPKEPLLPNASYTMSSFNLLDQVVFTTGSGEDHARPLSPSGISANVTKIEGFPGDVECGIYRDFEVEFDIASNSQEPVPHFQVFAKYGTGNSPITNTAQISERTYFATLEGYDGTNPVEFVLIDQAGNASDALSTKVNVFVDSRCGCSQANALQLNYFGLILLLFFIGRRHAF